jgi:4-hydroxybenzoate polyprenyltransferase
VRNTAFAGLLRACHPQACVAVAAVAALLRVAIGGASATWLLVGAAVLVGQLSIGWLNDLLDADRDSVSGRTEKPIPSGQVGRRAVGVAAVAAGVCCVVLSLLVGLVAGAVHLIAVVLAYAYDGWLKSTVLSVVPYLVSFGLLPVFVALSVPGAGVAWWLPTAGALLGGGAHFANVLPDLAGDVATGVHGLPHRLGATASRWCAAVLLVAAAVVLVVGPVGHTVPRLVLAGVSVVTLAVGLVLGRRPGSRAAFNAVLVVALLDVGQLLLAGTQA